MDPPSTSFTLTLCLKLQFSFTFSVICSFHSHPARSHYSFCFLEMFFINGQTAHLAFSFHFITLCNLSSSVLLLFLKFTDGTSVLSCSCASVILSRLSQKVKNVVRYRSLKEGFNGSTFSPFRLHSLLSEVQRVTGLM